MYPLRHQSHRRSLIRTATLAVASPVLLNEPAEAGPVSSRVGIALTGEDRSVVRSASVRLGARRLERVPGTRRFRTRRLETSQFAMVAVTWRGHGAPLWVRTRTAGSWSSWHRLAPLHDLPDRRSGEGNGVRGTDPLWVGASDAVQVSVLGPRPRDLALQLIDPGVLPSDRESLGSPAGLALDPPAETDQSTAETTGAPQPQLRYREQWGADESWRNGGPYYGRTIQQVHLHHTATSNGYSRSDVPALIRGMYRYHTHTLGWSDIGYNFLVDRFGRSWVGRAGGVSKVVRGAHTLGFNETSTGIAVIGNYEDAWPTDKVITAIVRLAAWKLDKYDRKPTGKVRVYSHGSDKYAAGTWVTLPVIDGHRDTNDTACPGRHLYGQLRKIRNRTQTRVDSW